MSHPQSQSEIDYEKQFQDDLAKATALSLEQQALDEYRRNKKYGRYERAQSTISNVSAETANAATSYYAQLRERYSVRNLSGSSDGGQLPESPISNSTIVRPTYPLAASHPRRHSEVSSFPAAIAAAQSSHGRNSSSSTANTAAATLPRSRTPPATTTTPESDLISFASPTSKQPETPGGGSKSFEQLIEDLHKLQVTNRTALVPLGPTAAAPNAMQHNVYRSAPPTAMYMPSGPPQFTNISGTAVVGTGQPIVGAAGMQLVPFTPPPAAQKVPLTNDELQKLYNMPHPQSALQHRMGMYMPYAAPQFGTQSAPSTAGVAAYPAPQFPQYGFKYNIAAQQAPVAAVGTAAYYQQQSPATVAANAAATGTASKSHSITSIGSNASVGTSSISNGGGASTSAAASSSILRRQTPPARRARNPGDDLIDLSQEEDSRVSVLEAFDPLLNDDNGGSRCVKNPKQ